MTLEASQLSAVAPPWRPVRCEFLQRDIQVKRPSISDIGLPVEKMWVKLVRDGDGSPLLPAGQRAEDCDPKLVEEICRLATENPTSQPD